MGKIYNIPASAGFADAAASRLLDEFAGRPAELADALILLPSARAREALKAAFVRARGLEPTILPKMIPIFDMDEDEILFSGLGLGSIDVEPAISKEERILLFARLIMSRPKEFGLSDLSSKQACFLARELGDLVDAAHNERASFAALADLVPEEYALHWQETLKFLEIITKHWPAILRERGLCDPALRRARLMALQAKAWRELRPERRVIAMGITATFPAMKELVAAVLDLPNGEVILAGLDKAMDEDDWAAVDASHPQFEFKELLAFLGVSRAVVADLLPARNGGRERLVAEIMRPSAVTDKWREIASRGIAASALHGVSTLSCPDIRTEAISIALIMREALEVPGKTAALVTADRDLARRVAAELKRWGISVDDSAGRPLGLTPPGVFFRLVRECWESGFAPVAQLALLKHPLARFGREPAELAKEIRKFELEVLRKGKREVFPLLKDVFASFDSLSSFKDVLAAHIGAAEAIVGSGASLWKGDAGAALAALLAVLHDKAEILGDIEAGQYMGVVEAMMAGVAVRPSFGTHPRLSILGPIEARLASFDVVVVGEANEGVFPMAASADPWLSRQMKAKLGLPPAEKAIGVAAQDFASLLCAERVYLARAERVGGAPTAKSRWWLRFEAVLEALGFKFAQIEDQVYKQWAARLDKAASFSPISAPEPRPSLELRPRELPVSAIEDLMRDPYKVFAKYILRLRPLDELEKVWEPADFGSLVHKALERFTVEGGSLAAIGEEEFAKAGVPEEIAVFWRSRFAEIADWAADLEASRRGEVDKVFAEVSGRFSFDNFTLTAKADRVEALRDGTIGIVDYKTGRARTEKELKAGYAPQLPLEGLIASAGGFSGVPAGEVSRLAYWQLGKKEIIFDKDAGGIVASNFANLRRLAGWFGNPEAAYYSQPNPKLAPKYSDYEHLSRAKEWSSAKEDSDG